jgi:hypothetical protein
MKKTVFWSVILLLTLSFIGWRYYVSAIFQPDPVRCGVIVDKNAATALELHKHSGTLSVEKVFTIKLDDGGYYEQEVGSDYAKFNIGDYVCYSYQPETTGGQMALDMLATILSIILSVIIFTGIIFTIGSLYDTFIDN